MADQPQGVPIQPVPMTLDVIPVPGPEPFVQLVFQTPTGVAAYFLPVDASATVREQMEQAEQRARSGLIVPGNGNIRRIRDDPQG